MQEDTRIAGLLPREAAGSSSTDQFLSLISDPFGTQIQSAAFFASLGTSLGLTLFIAAIFCLLRPFNTVVYAPRARHADDKHAPPPLGKGIFAWITPVVKTKEDMLVEKVGLDAAVFIRFTKMCRNIFLILSVVGCGVLIPVNVVGGNKFYKEYKNISNFMKMTPQYMFGQIFWALVLCAWLFDIVICFFLWRNYRAVVRLRRNYFESPEYQASLSARTLMVTDIPKNLQTDEGVVKVVDEVKNTMNIPRGAIARNVKDIPDLIEEHEELVRELEAVLAKYLKDPDNLPASRPQCKLSKKDPSYTKTSPKVDAIDYLTGRIKELEHQIKQARRHVDARDALSYGFASYESIDDAHGVAYAAQKKHPDGTSIRLAPRPNDIIWKNLPLTPKQRRMKNTTNNLWVVLLTLIWIAPNALIAVFLSNLPNLGRVWPAFQQELGRNPKTWAVVQGVLSPAITSLFYFLLPSLFRRLSVRAGDYTKTSRERHVTHKLYAFFIFNNLIVFSLFAAVWKFVVDIMQRTREQKKGLWDALRESEFYTHVMLALCNVSPFWIAWLLQRNLGAAVDLSQVWNLAWGSFSRKFRSPTPRQLIEWTAPPPFDYASYYNYFLFYATVALCFATLQPIVLPVTAFYFCLDSYLKKYLLLYIFITKTESGGQFWRVLFNRVLFGTFLSNVVIALIVKARGYSWSMLGAMVPLPFLLAGFKWYCRKTFDDQTHFYSTGTSGKAHESVVGLDKGSRRTQNVGVRFGHPALYKKLMTPMVHAKSQHLLSEIMAGRLDRHSLEDAGSVAGYSDVYNLHNMDKSGKKEKASKDSPFEFVSDAQMDFENFKNREDFRSEYGGDGSIYGGDISRPGTPATLVGHDRARSSSRDSTPSERTRFSTMGSQAEGDWAATAAAAAAQGTTYPPGYHHTPSRIREYSPSPAASTDRVPLASGAAPMPSSASGSHDAQDRPPRLGTPGSEMGSSAVDDPTSYDYFRRGRRG